MGINYFYIYSNEYINATMIQCRNARMIKCINFLQCAIYDYALIYSRIKALKHSLT